MPKGLFRGAFPPWPHSNCSLDDHPPSWLRQPGGPRRFLCRWHARGPSCCLASFGLLAPGKVSVGFLQEGGGVQTPPFQIREGGSGTPQTNFFSSPVLEKGETRVFWLFFFITQVWAFFHSPFFFAASLPILFFLCRVRVRSDSKCEYWCSRPRRSPKRPLPGEVRETQNAEAPGVRALGSIRAQ